MSNENYSLEHVSLAKDTVFTLGEQQFTGLFCDIGIHIVNLENFKVMFERIWDENTKGSDNPYKIIWALLEYNMEMASESGYPTPIKETFPVDANYLITGNLKKPILFLNQDLLLRFMDRIRAKVREQQGVGVK